MNIILFVNRDFEANLAYNLLKEELRRHQVRIYYSESVGSQRTKPEALQQLEYYEKTYFYETLPKSLEKQFAKVDFEFFDEDFSSFPLTKCTNVNAPEFIDAVKIFNPDLFISIRFGKIFKDEIIKVPAKGILNLHSAILPHYRGILGTLHNLREGKLEYGCTLHYISSSGIDTGEIVAIARRQVQKERSLLWHVVQLYPQGCQLILAAINELKSRDRLPVEFQDMNKGDYYSVPTDADFEDLKFAGFLPFIMEDYRELLFSYVLPPQTNEWLEIS
jgi:methionyl-tRNA formyltransferase